MATNTPSNKLEDQAATAALYATGSTSDSKHGGHPLLDEDGKLSSAGAATSLKYAKAQDLPSFPSAGLKMSSAGAAASLADSNKHSVELWKPGSIPAANKAAMLAKDYEMDPLWQPEMSAAGSKAALLANKNAHGVDLWTPSATEWGHSAAGQAVRAQTHTKYTDRDVPADAHRKALMAATGAMAGSRARAGSAPIKPANDGSWALKAATSSHKDSPVSQPFASGDPGFEAARIQNASKANRSMYGSAPPVGIEVQEKNRQDTLRASAVAMAQKMYALQQSHINEAAGVRGDSHAAANSSHRRRMSNDSDLADEDVPVAPRYENLEEAARKLAQERLAKLRDEHAEYRQYYGASPPQQRSRMSMRSSRRRASSTGDDDDEENSRRIRQQMSMFQTKLTEVDKNKRTADREALLEAAHKNVEARMAKMDQQVFENTGKASPAQREAWQKEAEARARERAAVSSQHAGKVHIGGGKYLDQSEIDAIARARVQPTLDDIAEKAEKQRARDEEIRLEQEEARARVQTEKTRHADAKAEAKATQNREKLELRSKRDEEKRIQRERTEAEKEEKRKSQGTKPGRFSGILGRGRASTIESAPTTAVVTESTPVTIESTPAAAESTPVVDDEDDEETPVVDGTPVAVETTRAEEVIVPVETDSTTATTEAANTTVIATTATHESGTVHDVVTEPTLVSEPHKSADVPAAPPVLHEDVAPTSAAINEMHVSSEKRDSGVKSWFKTRLRGTGKSQKDEVAAPVGQGGAAARDNSIRDVAMAGRGQETDDMYGSSAAVPASSTQASVAREAKRSSSISSLSSSDMEERGRPGASSRGIKDTIFKSQSNRGDTAGTTIDQTNTSDDEFEEARDHFEEKQLPPATAGTNEQPRTSTGESRFTEEL